MQNRQKEILKAVIQEYLKSAEPIGSKTLMLAYNFDVSPATIRLDMANLEKDGFLVQPHTSAGRIPTDKAYRMFVDDLVDIQKIKKQNLEILKSIQDQFASKKIKREIYDAISILASNTPNIAFATLPDSRTFYLGVSKILKSPEFLKDPLQASQVMETFEKDDQFIKFLEKLDTPLDKTEILIGKENLLQEIQSCSIIVKRYKALNYTGFIGILGPTRMNYGLNSIILEEICELLNYNLNDRN